MAVQKAENRAAPPTRPFHYLDSVYFQDGQWLTGVLVGILYVILAASLDAAGHVSNLSIVVPVTIGAYLLGVLMSFSRFDGFFALSHSMFVGLAWILYLMAGAVSASEIRPFLDNGIGELQARVYFVLLRLLDWVDAALTGKASADNFVFIFEICFLLWWLTYLGTWSVFRHGYTWRAIVPAGVVLLINTYYAPNSTVGFLAVWVFIALILLIRTNLAEQQLRWREQHIYFNPDIVWDFLRNSVLFSIALVLAAWVLPGLGRNPQVREVLAPITSRWEETNESMQRLYQGLNRRPSDEAANFTDSLSLGGERSVTDELVFQVQAIKARYWRAVVFDTYDGRGWLNTAQDERSYSAGEIVPVAAWRAREAISQTVTLLSPIGDVLFGAPEIAQADLRLNALARQQAGAAPIAVAERGTDNGATAVEFAMVRATRDLDRNESYRFTSAVSKATVQDLEGASTAYPAAILDRFVQIPPNFSPQVATLAQRLTADAETPYAKAKAIESYLRTIPYNDAIPAPPADQDPLEYFLFDIQEGYCDYYATAMAMMLRSVGIPARAVSGYAEGILDDETGAYFVTQRDAHTWVEVFFPEYGWIEFEPTAGESALDRPQSEQPDPSTLTSQPEDAGDQPESPLSQPTPPDNSLRDEPPPFSGEELLDNPLSGQDGGAPWWIWALALIAALGVGGFLVWRIRYGGPNSFAVEAPVLIFERLQLWAQRLGLGSTPAQTPYEHAHQVASALPETQPYVQEITDTYVQFRFNRHAATPAGAAPVDAGLNATWRKLERIFWRAWWQRLRQRLFGRRQSAASPYDLVERPKR